MYKAKSIRILTILLQSFQVGIFCFLWRGTHKKKKNPNQTHKTNKQKLKKHNPDFLFLANPRYFLILGENESKV